jgi:imidazolonepropionase-like amidohydrolase
MFGGRMKGFRALVGCGLAVACATTHAQPPRFTVITGATLIDGTARPALQDAVIVIDGARIGPIGARGSVQVPPGAAIVDGQGKFVIPGLADMHHHLISGGMDTFYNPRSILRRMLAVGVTTIFNPSIALEDFTALKAAAAGDSAPFARFFGTGPIVTVKGDFFGEGVKAPTPDTPAQAAAVIRDLKAAGVDAIKVQRDDFSWGTKNRVSLMKQDVLQALVDEAHRQTLKVFAHAPLLRYAKEALRAGVDGLMHGIVDEPVDPEFLTLMKRNRAVYVSTMGLYEDVGDVAAWARRESVNWDKAALQPPRFYDQFTNPAGVAMFTTFFNNPEFTKQHLPVQRSNLKAVFDAGIPIVLGTDTGFFGVLVGAATQVELELLVEAGLKPEDALRAATVNAARMIGKENEFGTVEAGKAADLVVLDADPRLDVRNATRISRTMKGGVWYDPVDPARPFGRRGR